MRKWIDADSQEEKLKDAIDSFFGGEHLLKEFLFDKNYIRLRKRPSILKEDAWSLDEIEQEKIKAALDIWSGSGHLFLFQMLEHWDKDTWVDFMKCICVLKNIRLTFDR